mgnify:CR=1 FL=1
MKELEEEVKKLFVLAMRGYQDAYRDLLKGISRVIRGYLIKTMNPKHRSLEQVEDLVQEILLAIHRKRGLYQVERPILPWIHAIARYRFIDFLRHQKSHPDEADWDHHWIEKFDAVAFVEQTEERAEELLEGLSEKQKEMLVLAKVERQPIRDIANRLGMSISAVKTGIHRSLKLLRKKNKK